MRRSTAAVALAAGVLAVVGCADVDESTAQARAEELVAATAAAGVAPELTADVAASFHGDDAPHVCGRLDDDPVNIVTWARVHRGVPQDKADELVAYDTIVVDVYCPEHTTRFRELLDDLHLD